MKKKRARAGKMSGTTQNGMIDFCFGNVPYQIDPSRGKVYRRWIEVETAKTSLIMCAFNEARTRKAV